MLEEPNEVLMVCQRNTCHHPVNQVSVAGIQREWRTGALSPSCTLESLGKLYTWSIQHQVYQTIDLRPRHGYFFKRFLGDSNVQPGKGVTWIFLVIYLKPYLCDCRCIF